MIYNGSKLHICGLPVIETLWPMNNMFETSDFTALDETYFKSVIRTLPVYQPTATKVLLDLEGTPAASEGVYGQRYWYYDEFPAETIANFDNAITWAQEVNAADGLGLEFGIYGWPNRTTSPATRETAMAPIIAKADFVSFRGYWSDPGWSFATWQNAVNIRETSLATYHTTFSNSDCYVYVSDYTGGSDKQLTASEFEQVIDDIQGRGMNPVYWTNYSREAIPFSIRAKMWAAN